jgi:hypothetical protein
MFSSKVQKSFEQEENKKLIFHEKHVWDLANEGLKNLHRLEKQLHEVPARGAIQTRPLFLAQI